jgi:hypothetical protein
VALAFTALADVRQPREAGVPSPLRLLLRLLRQLLLLLSGSPLLAGSLVVRKWRMCGIDVRCWRC